MSRPVVLTKQLPAAVVNGVSLAQALAAAGNLLINGGAATGGVAILTTQRRISILSSGDDSLLTWTVVGTTESGTVISETVAGGNAVAVVTLQDFKTVTRVSANGAVAGTVQVGTSDIGSTPWQRTNNHITPFEIGLTTTLISGAATWSIECTGDDPMMPIPIYQPGYSQAMPIPKVFSWATLAGLVASAASVINDPGVLAWRLTITVGTGTVRAVGTQAGIRN